jgi:hypothetical protein
MASMRRVTRKPPKMLTAAMKMPSGGQHRDQHRAEPICISAPRMMIDEIALVTAISGVCSECATFQITWKPMKTDSTKTMKCCMKLAGAISPTPSTSAAPTASSVTWFFGLRLEGGDLLGAAFLGRQFLGLFLLRRGGDGRDLGRRRREGDLALMGDRRAADHVILHVVTTCPSFSGVRSVIMWRMLVA